MTQEVRITVDANLYCHHAAGFLIDEARFEWKKRITDYIKANAFADHKFVNVKVDIIPHDNDRDYTEEDAEKHLNGETERRRETYADRFIKMFPHAPWDRDAGTPATDFNDFFGAYTAIKVAQRLSVEEDGKLLSVSDVCNEFTKSLNSYVNWNRRLWLADVVEDADA